MNKIKFVLYMLLVISVLINGTAIVHAMTAGESVSVRIDEFCEKTKCGSVSVVVVNGDETEFYGDPDGLYQIGSMTKAFTGLAVRKLISEGLLSEDDKLSELLPGFTAYYDGEACDITVGQLLSQTSGYTNNETVYPGAEEDMTLAEWADTISGRELTSVPGAEYAYSNVNYNLLGTVIERVSGKSYAEYMETEILTPLGLFDTYVQVPADTVNIIRGSRLGYRHGFEYEIPVVTGRIPAGYFYSDASDMARWIRIWTGTADIPEEYKSLVSSVKEMLGSTGDYDYGWEVFENGTIGHSGGTPNYSSRIVFSEREQTGVCVLTNMNIAASTDSLCNGIYAAYAGGTDSGLKTDVWTVFDLIFTALTVIGMAPVIMAALTKRRIPLIVTGSFLIILMISICVTMPIVFGAGLRDIMLIWAPYSFTGGLLALAAGILAIGIKLWKIRKNGN